MRLYLNCDFAQPLTTYHAQHTEAYRLLDRLLKEDGITQDMDIEKDDYGKPYLKGFPSLCFNISHCSVCVAAVVSRQDIGVDVQGHFPWKEKLAKKISSRKEWRYLQNAQSDEERRERLNRLWCRKESYLKCIGLGLRRELSEVNVLTKEDKLLHTEEGRFRFTEFQSDQYTLCVCERVEG